jgi:hypothetical protein
MADKWFHDQFDTEECYGYFRRHWITLVPAFLRLSIDIGLIYLVIWILSYFLRNYELDHGIYQFVILVTFFVAIYEIHLFFLRILSWFLTKVILTDLRVVEVIKTIYMQDEKEAVDLKKVQDIQMRKIGFIRNMLDFGRIHLTLANITDSKEIRQVPKVSMWVKRFNQVRIKSISTKKVIHKDREIDELRSSIEDKANNIL